jgi:D-2-hydroxyacid dehydrogenase (NADP+)
MKTLLIRLSHKIAAFHLQPFQVELLRNAVGDRYEIVVATSKDEFLERLPDADACVCWRFRKEWYDGCPKLTTIHTPAAGHDWIERDPSGKVSVQFGTFHGRLMRESAVAMMLHFSRRIELSMRDQRTKAWDRERYSPLTSLYGSHVVIIGYGAIGKECASVLKPFGCQVTGVKRDATVDPAPADAVVAFDELSAALTTADHVLCILPGGQTTDNLLKPEHFAAIKPGAYFYNLGRGNCYRESDLVDALTDGPLAGAGLDVFATEPLPKDSPLWDMENVIISPHVGAQSPLRIPVTIDLFCQNIVRFRDGKSLLNQVDKQLGFPRPEHRIEFNW